VTSPQEAISCYLRTGMDVLVLGDFYTTDRGSHTPEEGTDRVKAAPAREPAAEVALTARASPAS
jgi:hypothetical protein